MLGTSPTVGIRKSVISHRFVKLSRQAAGSVPGGFFFPVEGCSWFSNAVHKIHVRWQQGHEFNRTTDMDRYVVSPDLKKAFYLEGGVEVSYPFPFVNAKPDLSAEEMRDKRIGDEMKECVSESRKTLFKSIEPVVSNKRYIVKTDNSFGTWYVIFEDDGKSFSYAEYYPEIEDYEAQLILFKHCPDRSLSSRMCLFFDGDLGELHVVKGERVEKHDDASFKRAFAREVLTRLKLNAADLPGINLDAILGEPEAKK